MRNPYHLILVFDNSKCLVSALVLQFGLWTWYITVLYKLSDFKSFFSGHLLQTIWCFWTPSTSRTNPAGKTSARPTCPSSTTPSCGRWGRRGAWPTSGATTTCWATCWRGTSTGTRDFATCPTTAARTGGRCSPPFSGTHGARKACSF